MKSITFTKNTMQYKFRKITLLNYTYKYTRNLARMLVEKCKLSLLYTFVICKNCTKSKYCSKKDLLPSHAQ